MLVCFSFCFVQSRSQNFQFRTYSFTNGLSSYNANKIVQDKFGFIWVATQEGINRFDGKNFIAVKKDPVFNNGLSENFVTDVATDENGKLWIASALGGIDVLNAENFTIEKRLNADSISKPLLTNWVRCIAWSAQNELWIGTYYGFNIYNKETNRSLSFTENPFNKSHALNICFEGVDSMHNIWLDAENDGVLIYNTASKKIIAKLSKEDFGVKPGETFCIKNLYIESANEVYACSNKGLKRVIINEGKYSVASVENTSFKKIKDLDIRSIVQDNYGDIWVGTDKGVSVINKNNDVSLIQHSNFSYNTILDDNINYLFKDGFGNIWITTTKGLNLLMNDQYIFREFNAKAGTLSEMHSIYTLYPDSDSIIFACGATGLFSVNIKNFTLTKILKSEEYGEIESITRINENEFLVSSDERLLVLTKQFNDFSVRNASTVFKELSAIEFNYFSACLKYNDSLILLASMEDEGLIKWNYKNHSLQQFKNTGDAKNYPYENSFHNIKQDKAGNIWLLSNSSITKYDAHTNAFKNYFPAIKNQIQPHFFFDLYDDGKYLWITSYGAGLIRFNTNSNTYNFYTEKNGFSSNATYSILSENDSVLWVSSNKGLTRFNTASEKASAYFLDDGLQSDAFDERSACNINDHLFFGGIDGFTEISKNKLFNTAGTTPVYIGKIMYADVTGKPVEINAVNATALKFKTLPVSFQIITPDYTNNSRISYAYKLQELDNNWIQLGKNNLITLAGLSPGSYHFIGRIYNADNVVNESKVIEFTILPKWYQTTIFKIALFVLAIIIVFGIYRYRTAQIKMQKAQLHQVREEIANDLHDDIGSTLNGIKIFTHLAEHATDKEKYFEQIKQSLKHVSEGLRDMIWVLDDNNDTAEHLLKRLQLFVQPVADASNIHIDFIIEGLANTQLNKKEKRNLLMIAKEAVNNSIKYADCKNMYVVFKIANDVRLLTIQDDGKGFLEDAITPGNGLKNMRTRTEQIGYKIKLITRVNEGTVIEIKSSS